MLAKLARRGAREHNRVLCSPRYLSSDGKIYIAGKSYALDEWSNISPTILDKLDRARSSRYTIPRHPLAILKSRIEQTLPDFKSLSVVDPVVSVSDNFDRLGFTLDHPGRSKTDTYYVNRDVMLQTHTSVHEVSTFATGIPKWLLTADVYRRDEIDATHYPVFHQMEGARQISVRDMDDLEQENSDLASQLAREKISVEDETRVTSANPYQTCHEPRHAELVTANLKLVLNKLIVNLFRPLASQSQTLRIRWIDAYFPFTSPSYEVEVFFGGKWLELLGSGVVNDATLQQAGRSNYLGWAFGLGLERICMPLFSIPDIRLFWTDDERFLSQFESGSISTFKPYSKYPSNYKDISFWAPTEVHDNDVYEMVRDVSGDLVESVSCIDRFVHPKSHRLSLCYRIHYRSMDRSLPNDEVILLHQQLQNRIVQKIGAEIR